MKILISRLKKLFTTYTQQLSVQLETKMESVTVCFHGVTLLTNVPSELDSYMSIRNSKRSDDFVVGVAALAFCFFLDKMCYFMILIYELATLLTIFKVNCVYVVNNFFKRDINIFIMYESSSEGTFVNNVTPWKQSVTLSIFASNWTLSCLPCFVNIASTLIVNNNFLFML
jgi:hypothetical protein